MSVKLRASSGSYNVRASELASQVIRPSVTRTVKCTVHFLDDTEATFEIDKRAKAGQLLDKVFEHLELIERDYFGLQYVDVGPNAEGMHHSYPPLHPISSPQDLNPVPPTANVLSSSLSSPPQISPSSDNSLATNSDSFVQQPLITSDVMRWLDPLKTLKKQLRVGPPYILYFRVKFYVSDPSKLHEEYTRYHFFLQVKKDIAEGKLVVPYKTAVLLASYAVQSELGDYHPDEHVPGYLAEFRFVPNTTEDFEGEVCDMHKQHKGLNPADSEMKFLQNVAEIETYGVDLHHAYWDQNDIEIQLGVTSVGLVVFQKNVRINTFSWAKIVKISFKRKQFFIQLRKENDTVENLIGFNMVSYRSCKNLWKSCVEHHTFFRLHSPPQSKSSIFSLGSKFRYSEKDSLSDEDSNGRTEFQALEDSKRRARIERTFTRSPSKRYARRTVGATTRDAIMTERNAIDGYHNTPHSTSVDSFPSYPSSTLERGSRGTSPQKQYTAAHMPNSSSYPLGFPNNSRTSGGVNANTTGNGSAIYNNNNNGSLTRYHQQQPTHHQHTSSNLSSNSTNISSASPSNNNIATATASTVSPQHSANTNSSSSALSSQSQSSFQHSTARSTLPNDYKPNTYASKSGGGGSGWVTPQPTSSNVTSRTVTPQPAGSQQTHSQLNTTTTSDNSSRLSRSFDSRSLDRKEKRKSRGYNNGSSAVDGVSNGTNYGGTLDSRTSVTSGNSEQRVTSPTRQHTTGATTGGKGKRDADESGGFRDHQQRHRHLQSKKKNGSSEPYAPSVPSKQINSLDETASTLTDQSYELPNYNEYPLPNGNAYSTDGHGLVTIKMKPDTQGRFGFNVKGGKDQGMPIIVSRVAPGTPADVCIPRLNEGDQVLFINGRDVSQHNHEQVVMFIRASRETHSGELVLFVRPNVYIGDETADNEPDFQYIPDTHHISATLPPGGNALDASLMLLQEGLESGAALAQFEQLYRKKPGLTMNAARLDANLQKNRYRDISPYDQTRVKIKTQSGDYINANFVNMEIPGSGIINRYIAAQGPLPNTSNDFWQMVWEQHCTLVVMLTTNVERGRVKCHQYWPQLYDTSEFGNLQVTCLKEENTQSFAFREFTLVDKNDKKEERHITQMQYISWPDHGVPDDATDFLDFVIKVRQRRSGMTEPTIVHCSAGIGRTGVLITMETAMCLIESNQPVYPLDIVRQMRDQRAMLIQTSSQYKFVCEAILKVHSDKIVEPLEEFR